MAGLGWGEGGADWARPLVLSTGGAKGNLSAAQGWGP